VLFGYQGWFATGGDGSGCQWKHWSNDPPSLPPAGDSCAFDLWPDVSEFSADELYDTRLHYSNGKVAQVFSAHNAKTVDRHFKWMQNYTLDGVFLQRFVGELSDPVFYNFRNNVTQHVMTSAQTYTRDWAIMYDISGANPSTLLQVLTNDWNFLVQKMRVLDSPQYLRENGKPVLCIWGFGFTDRNFDQNLALQVINYFKTTAGVYLMGGVPYWWRTEDRDSKPNFLQVYQKFDLLSPWAVGRYNSNSSFDGMVSSAIQPDIQYCSTSNIAYAPVIFPGFSWANLQKNRAVYNQIPRNSGEFFWHQGQTFLKRPGVRFIYIAMFDEVNEGTAMLKAASQKSDTPSDGTFLYLSADGKNLPSDHYLRLAGQLTQQFKAERSTV